jgi:transketolase
LVKRIDPSRAGSKGSLRDTFAASLTELARERDEIVVLDGDNSTSSMMEMFAAAHPTRFLQMGVAEQNMVGVAAGLATMGLLPFVNAYACFQVYRGHDQIRVLVAQTGLPVRLVGGSAGLLFAPAGKTHQTVDDVATLRAMPGMTIVSPADEVEVRQVANWLVDYPAPAYIRLTRGTSPTIFDETYRFAFPEAVVVHEGSDVGLISTGVQTTRVLEAVPALEAAGIRPLILHVPTLKPVDEDAIEAVARQTGRIVTVEDHNIIGGLGGAVCEVLAERCPVPVKRLGIQDQYAESAPTLTLLEKYGLSAGAVARAVIDWLAPR